MRILFMGTPDIAADCLKALYEAGHDICAVYTRRDKPVGRKQVLTAPPVKEVALAHGTPVFQPRTLRDGGEDENIRALAPELIVVVAYGCILPRSVLEAPKYGCINLHVSLLPKYRGSAPVQWAVLNGDAETGVSIMQMDEGLDTGDVLACEKIAIDPEETSGQLFDRVTAVGARVLCETLPAIAAGTLKAEPQAHENASVAPMLSKEMAEFKLTDSADHIHNCTRQLFSEVISRQEATDEQSTRLGVVRETFSRWLNQPDWGRGNEKFPTETVDYSVLQRALSAEVDLYCQQMAKVLAEQVDESVTAGMNTFFAEFASCLTELQTRLRESLALRQQNESVVRLMQQQLQQAVMTHSWIYTDAQLLRDDIQTLFTAERY